jgi:hypothetical protein
MKKRILIIIILLLILVCSLFYKREIKQLYYSYQEYVILNNSIIWSYEKKLKLSDFSYEPEKTQMDNVAVTVGIVSVHKISEKITHRSTTIFKPENSFVTSKTDSLILRIAQARFNLCELYRRKMELKISSLNLREIKKTNSDTITKYEELYYDLFEKEWDKFNDIEKKELNKGLIKMEKYIEQALK